MKNKIGSVLFIGLLGWGLISTSLAANGEANSSFASKINRWFGSLTAQISASGQNQTGQSKYSCGCRFATGGDFITLSKTGISTGSCENTDASSACPKLCESYGAQWTEKHSCFDISPQYQSYYSVPSQPANPAQYYKPTASSAESAPSTQSLWDPNMRGEYSCLCNNVWKTGKTECGKYALDKSLVDPILVCPDFCAKAGTLWMSGFDYKVVKCEKVSSGSIAQKPVSPQKTWTQMSWTERGSIMNRIKSERGPLKIKISSASYDVGKGEVVLTWQAENASKCRIWLQGFTAQDNKSASGSVSFPVERLFGNTKILGYNIRCFTDTEVQYDKTGMSYGKAKGGYVKIPASRGGI